MNKHDAEVIAGSKEVRELVDKQVIHIHSDRQYRIGRIDVLQMSSEEYSVLASLDNLYGTPRSMPVTYEDLKANYKRMTYGDKVRTLHREATHKLGLFYQAESEYDFFSSSFGPTADDVTTDRRQETYQEWQFAQGECTKLMAFIRKNNINPNTFWVN